MTSGQIKACVASYLRYRRQCLIVAFERGPFIGVENPDVLAVTDGMRLLEVEVKVTLSDFRADAKKRKWHPSRVRFVEGRIFYYAVPPELSKIVCEEARPGAGVMSVNYNGYSGVTVVKKADHKNKPKIGMQTFMEMVRAQTGTLIGLASDLEIARSNINELRELNKREAQ